MERAHDPHADASLVRVGPDLVSAAAAVILLHGRGATAEGILDLARQLDRDGIAWLAPQAAGSAWYPQSFLAPLASNEPWLSSALALVRRLVAECGEAGIPPQRIALAGFSQGGCLASEYVARNARRYGALAVLSGGLIGPPGAPREYAGSLDGTPAFLGCSDSDPHVPLARFEESARVLEALGAEVDARVYPGMGHTVNRDELEAMGALLDHLVAGDRDG